MTTPATWNTGSGAWFIPGNWDEPNPSPPPATLHYVPGVNEDVNIPDNSLVGTPFTITYAGTSTINTLTSSGALTLELQTGSLTIANGGGTGVFIENGIFNVASGFVLTNNAGTLSFNGGALAGTMAGTGTFRFINGTFDLNAGLSMTVANWLLSYQVGRATVSTTNLNTDLTYAGNFTIDAPFGNPAILNLNSHTLTLTGTSALGGNVVGPGTIRILGDATLNGGSYTGGALLQVAKTVAQTGSASQAGGFGLLGTLQVDAGATYTITTASGIDSPGLANQALIVNNGSFADNGVSANASRLDVGFTNGAGATLSVAAGATLKVGFADFRGSTNSLYNGAITGGGTLWLSGNSTLSTTTQTVGAILAGDSTTIGRNLTYGGQFTLAGFATLELGNRTLTLSGTSDFTNGFNRVDGTGTLRITGTSTLGGVTIGDDAAATLRNSGATTQTSGITLRTGSTLLNDVGKTYTLAGGDITLLDGSGITNNGTFLVTNANTANHATSDGSFTNAGTLTVGAGATLQLGISGSATLGGTVGGAGALVLAGAVAVNTQIGTASLAANGIMTLGVDLAYAGAFSFGTFARINLAGHTLTLSGTAALTGGFNRIDGGGTLKVTGSATFAGFSTGVTTGVTVQNAGAVTQTDSISLDNASTLLNDATRTYTLAGGDITLNGGSSATNNGTLLVTTTNTALHIVNGGSFTNAGTLTVGAGATLQFAPGGSATLGGTVGGAGTLLLGGTVGVNTQIGTTALAMNGVATLGTDLSYAGTFSFGTFARINLASHTLTLAGTSTLTGGFNRIDGAGTLKVTGSATFNGFTAGGTAGVTLQNSGAVTQAGTIALEQASTLLNDATRTYTLDGGDITLNGGSSAINNGTLLVTSANSALHAISGGSFTNAGTLTVGTGATLQLGNSGGSATLGGTVGGAGALVLAGAVAVNTQIGTASLAANGITTLGVDLNYAGGFSFGIFARINLASHTLTLAGTSTLAGGFNSIDGGGTLKVTGSATFNGFSAGVTTGVTLQNSGAITQTDRIDLGNGSTLLNDLGRTYTLAGGDIALNGSSVTNNGTFLVTNANTANHDIIGGSFTNAGSLQVGAGATLRFGLSGGSATLGGTVGGAGTLVLGNAALNSAVTTAGLIIGFGGTTVLGLNMTYAGAFAINQFATLALGGRTLTLTGGVDIDGNLQGSAGVDRLIIKSALVDLGGLTLVNWTAGTDVLQISGTTGADSIIGSTLGDSITGGRGTDTLAGGNGNDTLNGGRGADSLTGGAGNDLYLVDNAGDITADIPGGGQDTVQASVNATLGAEIEDLILTGTAKTGTGNTLDNRITGTIGANSLSGLDGADTLTGGGGADTLNGDIGADSMAGGTGNDTYIVDDVGDAVLEVAGEGTDEVRTSLASYTLDPTLENLTLLVGAVNGTGNAGNNTITGNTAANLLSGLDGRDLLVGGNGDDTLFGDAANDTLEGGLGRDSLDGGPGADLFRWMAPNHGRDTIAGFAAAQDSLAVSAGTFGGGLVAGTPLLASQLELNTTGVASTTAVRFVLNTTTGVLTYDADGANPGAAVNLTTFTGGVPALTAGNFVVIA